ncbi:MAG: hypothetical protein M3132_10950 [Actinomycetia bacterium]|nr:hypothetical protein [Actinomycetes bacterium]
MDRDSVTPMVPPDRGTTSTATRTTVPVVVTAKVSVVQSVSIAVVAAPMGIVETVELVV